MLHPLDQAAKVIVEIGDLVCLQAKCCVRVLPDLPERMTANRCPFGALVFLRVVVIMIVVIVTLVVVVVVVVVFVGHSEGSLRRGEVLEHPCGIQRLAAVRATANRHEVA